MKFVQYAHTFGKLYMHWAFAYFFSKLITQQKLTS